MKTDQEVTRETINNLLEDVRYLLDEAEALKYVIDEVPYKETPPGGMSIYNRLELIDHAQKSYYRPIAEKVFSENRIHKLNEYEYYRTTFEEAPSKEELNIQKTLSDIIKHRAALLNFFEKITVFDWERKLKNRDGNEITLFDFASQMVKEERAELKEVADLVLIYQNERQHQREINRKRAQRKPIE